MNNIKLTIVATLTLFLASVSSAQDTVEPPAPKLNISFSNSNPKTGDIIEVIFKMDIPNGFHLYSTSVKCEIGPFPFVIYLDKSDAYCTIGSLYSVGDKIMMDEVFECEVGEFVKNAEFRQKIKVIKNDVAISGRYEGQLCTETTCFNIGMLIPAYFTGNLKVEGSETNCDDKSIELPNIPEIKPTDSASKSDLDALMFYPYMRPYDTEVIFNHAFSFNKPFFLPRRNTSISNV